MTCSLGFHTYRRKQTSGLQLASSKGNVWFCCASRSIRCSSNSRRFCSEEPRSYCSLDSEPSDSLSPRRHLQADARSRCCAATIAQVSQDVRSSALDEFDLLIDHIKPPIPAKMWLKGSNLKARESSAKWKYKVITTATDSERNSRNPHINFSRSWSWWSPKVGGSR